MCCTPLSRSFCATIGAMQRKWSFWLMVLVLMGAALLRLPALEQAPPGLHYDEAANAILSADIGLRGDRPVFIPDYTGKEVFFFYLAGFAMRLVGESVLALRLTAAFVGIITVAATYWLGRELFPDRARGRDIGLFAAALLAASFAHVLFSRLGFRAITQPLLQAMTIAALLRGIRTQQWRWLVVGGVFLGLTAYAYLAARLFPLVIAVALLPLLWTRSRQRWAQIGVFLTVALLVAAPLLGYFMRNPERFWVRINQVSAESGSGLSDNLIRSFGMFFVSGDPYWRFNIPGKPLLGIVIGLTAIAGWAWLLTRWRQWRAPWQRAALLVLLFAPLIMLLPTALAVGEIVPSNLRAIGVMPFIFVLPAVALRELVIWLPLRRPSLAMGSAALAIVIVGVLITANSYFNKWATRSDVFYENDSDLVAMSAFIDAHDPSVPLFAAALHYRHPTVAFSAEQYDMVKWLPNSAALILPADGSVTVVYPHSSPAPAWALPLLKEATRSDGPPGPDGEPLYTAFALDTPAPLPSTTALDANFSNLLRLNGYAVAPGTAGGTLPVTLLWEVVGTTDRAVLPFIHIEDQAGFRWGQVESFAYPAEQWEVGETIVQHAEIALPPGMPTDAYRLHVGLFDANSAEQLPVLDSGGRFAGSTVQIEPVVVVATAMPTDSELHPPIRLDAAVLPGLQLVGYERGGSTATGGEPFWLALWWQATDQLPPSLATRLYLTDPNSIRHLWLETQPVQGRFPFADWSAPLFVRDHVVPTVPLDVPGGTYTVELDVTDGNETLFTADLGELTVTATERSFVVPPDVTATDATFGNEIALAGYTMIPVASESAELTLVWQALRPPSADYTVFVHVLNPDGTCCAWQSDSPPRQGLYPTSRWLPGEVITDTYLIELTEEMPPGIYPIEIGFYLPANGQRLSVHVPGLPDADFFYLEPLEVE
ncbi:MAG: glycosyltransferase family 39 protein [Anaerolineae bacterium]|nr:glycosyltransferase family 39 protein [Anaerolineae bacterium]